MKTADALQLVAMWAVVRGDDRYYLRHILRWYSRTFSTPLHVVEELPIEDILQTYFESCYEEMTEEERRQEILRLLETEEERRQKQVAEDIADAEATEFAKLTEQQIQKKTRKNLSKAVAALKETVAGIQEAAERIPDLTPEVAPPEPRRLPPDIRMHFLEPTDFDELLEGGFGPKKPSP